MKTKKAKPACPCPFVPSFVPPKPARAKSERIAIASLSLQLTACRYGQPYQNQNVNKAIAELQAAALAYAAAVRS